MLLTQPQVELHWVPVGRCRQVEALARRRGAPKVIDFPSYVGVIQHPDAGWILFDTGYGPAFFEATERMPGRLYRLLLPVSLPEEEQLTRRLADLGVDPSEVTRVVVSHFHGDHVSGLRELPNARIVCAADAAAQIQTVSGLAAVRHGLLPDALPVDFAERVSPIEQLPGIGVGAGDHAFRGRDLLGDRSLVVVDLPGHLPGHLGLLLTTASGQVMLVGDAAWSLRAITDDTPPSRIAMAMMDDAGQVAQTLHRLHLLARSEPELSLLPSHCAEAAAAWDQRSA